MATQGTTAAAASSPADLLLDREFEYLLNRMHVAGEADNPYLAGYAKHRRALFEYVADLQRRADRAPAPPRARVELTDAAHEVSRLTRIADAAWQCWALDQHNDTPWDDAWERLSALLQHYTPMEADPMLEALTPSPVREHVELTEAGREVQQLRAALDGAQRELDAAHDLLHRLDVPVVPDPDRPIVEQVALPLADRVRLATAGAREQAAQVCEGRARSLFHDGGRVGEANEARKCASAIRSHGAPLPGAAAAPVEG